MKLNELLEVVKINDYLNITDVFDCSLIFEDENEIDSSVENFDEILETYGDFEVKKFNIETIKFASIMLKGKLNVTRN